MSDTFKKTILSLSVATSSYLRLAVRHLSKGTFANLGTFDKAPDTDYKDIMAVLNLAIDMLELKVVIFTMAI